MGMQAIRPLGATIRNVIKAGKQNAGDILRCHANRLRNLAREPRRAIHTSTIPSAFTVKTSANSAQQKNQRGVINPDE